MKQLVTLLAAVALGFLAYKHHTEQVRLAAEKAAAQAAAAARRSMQSKATPTPRPLALPAIAISRVVEPFYSSLFAPLDLAQPADLVPPLEITKERILDMQTHAEPEKGVVYNKGIALLNAMISLAEERTKTLEAVIKAAGTKGTLDAPHSTSSSTAFFTQTTLKRWEDEKKRQKPALDQLFVLLRTAERDWNKRVGRTATVESYDLPGYTPVLITTDQPISTTANPLERGAYDQRRAVRPWRDRYYDANGYPQTTRSSIP